jgi:sensor histidine kinase YesM
MFSAFVFAFVTVFNHDLGLTDYADMLIIPTNFLILIIAVKVLHTAIPQTKLILIGTFGVLLAATLAGISEIFELKNNLNFWLIPIICYAFGAVWELSWFSLALSERTRLIQLENQTLQKNYTKQLETELAERVNIIQTQNKLLEEQRIISLTSEFEQKIAETEISALRSQMNPHFIFNCLNSIKLYSLENDSQAASDYLTKFSRLIRMVLENSRSEKVTLENELETLELYIQMEAMRFKDKVKYQINIDQNIDQQFIEIPPLLIQPFVENAIWHGLMHKTEGGLVKIDVSQPKDQMLLIEISDNGIGREKALAYKSKSVMKNKSLGMKVTSERIELINQIYKTNTNVEIIDLKDKNGEALGTKVILNIPI